MPSSVERSVRSPVNEKLYTIRVDFLTPLDDVAGRRHVPIQDDLFARKVRGCEAAFRHHTTVILEGRLPDGGRVSAPVRMADVVASLTMKGIVLGERYREKDAYDIYALAAHYGGGPRAVAETLRPHLSDPLIAEGMRTIRSAFADRSAAGPAWAAGFLVSPVFSAEYERRVTETFMAVRELTGELFDG